MKRIFYLSLFLLSNVILFAQTPGGIGGSVLWLKGNTGASPSLWTDNSTSANNFTALPASQPVLATNVFNYNAALQFNGSSTFMTQPAPANFPVGNADRTIFVVANATDVTGYRWIFVYGSPGTGSATCQVGNNAGGISNAFYGVELTTAPYWNAVANITGGMSAFTLNSNTGNQFDRGNLINQVVFTTLTATSINGIIGALDPSPQEVWAGSIGEVIMFNTALSYTERNRVESYLALKYGFTLDSTANHLNYTASDGTTVYWTGSAIYQHDVFGIGTDNGTALTQTQSNSMNSGAGDGTGKTGMGNLVLSTGTALADKQFLMIGNDAGVLTEHLIVATEAPVIAEGSQRVVRNWKVQNTGAAGPVDLSFDITGLTLTGGNTASNYRLMIDQDGDGDYFNTGTQNFVKPVSFTGNRLNFSGVTLSN
ncbi:MAG: hypothetical protein ABIR15_15100, partial [Chitinophagaceae bacterium]